MPSTISDRPAHQGIETPSHVISTVRILSQSISDRPAHQGIETLSRDLISVNKRTSTISDRPAHQGIETSFNDLFDSVKVRGNLSVTAPLIRGLKHGEFSGEIEELNTEVYQ